MIISKTRLNAIQSMLCDLLDAVPVLEQERDQLKSYYKDQTRTKTLMDMYELPANSPELRELLASHPCPLYEHK